ncbi:MAG: hypothetical protein H6R47_25 [Proteobacteria bacterium]|nr:hypothetical protein [Pseudomonadota bacterium]
MAISDIPMNGVNYLTWEKTDVIWHKYVLFG